MSTFNGVVSEFPKIRVDFFRNSLVDAPLACFLSHVHSDHLAGLESIRSPFVYCSAATREMLLRLERYPCRINYAKGILEARVQTYKHLKSLLKPLPLETPTTIELAPGNQIQVTLFDANHCPGAVMFLFEGDGKAVLYTGDIRSEPWFVNALARSPCLAEYTSGIKTIDTIYLDTSFTERVGFQTKIQGIQELIRKVRLYPQDTIFHFQAWTFGYEDVWVALSKALNSKIHVDKYKMSIYGSLVQKERAHDNQFARQYPLSPEAAGLVGFMCGNTHHPGCLTPDHTVRLHSCEKGNYCSTVQNSPVVWIQPVVARLPDGQSIDELGVGGGGGDLERDAELDYIDPTDVESLLAVMCDGDGMSNELQEAIRHMLLDSWQLGRKVPLDLEMSSFGDNNEVALGTALEAIAKKSELALGKWDSKIQVKLAGLESPNKITFPYSRHSSYPELCDLVNIFKPRDIYPCTVHLSQWRREGITIERLFGDYCSGDEFNFDQIFHHPGEAQVSAEVNEDTQATTSSTGTSVWNTLHISPSVLGEKTIDISDVMDERSGEASGGFIDAVCERGERDSQPDSHGFVPDPAIVYMQNSQDSEMSQQALETRLEAFRAVLGNATRNLGHEIGLLSTRDHHTELEQDLGESQSKY